MKSFKERLFILEDVLSKTSQEELLKELQSYEAKGPLASEYCECNVKSLNTIGLYDQLPSPNSTEDVVRKGYGSYYEIYSPTLMKDELVWKKVAWSY